MLPEWLRKLFGGEEDQEIRTPVVKDPQPFPTEEIEERKSRMEELVRSRQEKPEEVGFLTKLFGTKTVSKTFDREPEPLPGTEEIEPINKVEDPVKGNEGVKPQTEDITQPQVTDPDNPYADWTKAQLKEEIQPRVLQYLDDTWLPLTDSLGIPHEISAAQWAIESGREIKSNPVGLMRNNQLLDYGTLKNTAIAYDETLRDIITTNMGMNPEDFRYEDFDTQTLLHFLQFGRDGEPGEKRYEAHMENPQNYIDMINSVPEWRYYSRF